MMKKTLTEDDMDEIKEVFRINSTQRHVPVKSIPIMLHALGVGMEELESLDIKAALYKIGIDVDDAGDEDIDSYRNGLGTRCADLINITLPEFVEIAKPHLLNRDPIGEAEKLFELFDEDKNGYISIESLRRVAEDVGLGDHYTDGDFKEMIQDASSGECSENILRKADFVRMNVLLAENKGYASSSDSDESK